MIPKSSPYHAGSHDPIAVVALFTDGTTAVLRLPDGAPVSPGGMMHVSACMAQPKLVSFNTFSVNREKWLSMRVVKDKPEPYFTGGAEAKRPLRRYQDRTIAYTVHKDSSIRLFDVGHNDQVENPDAIEADIRAAVGKPPNEPIKITVVSASSQTADMAVGLESGEVVIYRWAQNKSYHSAEASLSPNGPNSPNGMNGSMSPVSPTTPVSPFGRGAPGRGAPGRPLPSGGPRKRMSPFGSIRDISSQTDPAIKEGLLPHFVVESSAGAVKAIAVSDIGFIAVGYVTGTITIIDLKGPNVIYTTVLSSVTKEGSTLDNFTNAAKRTSMSSITNSVKRGSLAVVPGDMMKKRSSFGGFGRKSSVPDEPKIEKKEEAPTVESPVTMTFSIMTLEDKEYSSICLHVGTTRKNVVTFEVIPQGTQYIVNSAGLHVLDDPALTLIPVNADTGAVATASQEAIAGLQQGTFVNGILVCVSKEGARVMLPADDKLTSRDWQQLRESMKEGFKDAMTLRSDNKDDMECVSAGVVEVPDKGVVLACVMSTRKIMVYSLPALKDIGSIDIPDSIPDSRLSECQITREGFFTAPTGQTEIGLFNMLGSGRQLKVQPKDILHNPEIPIPQRPTISSLQWIKGTTHITATDFDTLIGGPNRPESKRAIAMAQQRSNAASNSAAGVFANMTNAFNQRTQNLSNIQDNMQHLSDTTNEFKKAAGQMNKKTGWGFW